MLLRSARRASDGAAFSIVDTGNETSRCRIVAAVIARLRIAARASARHKRHGIEAQGVVLLDVLLKAPEGVFKCLVVKKIAMVYPLLLLQNSDEGVAPSTWLASTEWMHTFRAIGAFFKGLLLTAPAIHLRTARAGRPLVGLDGSKTADAFLRLLAAGHHGAAGTPTAGTTASFGPQGAISRTGLGLGPGGLGLLPHGIRLAPNEMKEQTRRRENRATAIYSNVFLPLS